MTFTIHITHRHTEGAGLHNEYYERDIPCDEDIEIEIADEEVNDALVHIIVDTSLEHTVSKQEYKLLLKVVEKIIDDNGLFDALCENYVEELNEWAQEQYGDD